VEEAIYDAAGWQGGGLAVRWAAPVGLGLRVTLPAKARHRIP
jgi:hypothetical protein